MADKTYEEIREEILTELGLETADVKVQERFRLQVLNKLGGLTQGHDQLVNAVETGGIGYTNQDKRVVLDLAIPEEDWDDGYSATVAGFELEEGQYYKVTLKSVGDSDSMVYYQYCKSYNSTPVIGYYNNEGTRQGVGGYRIFDETNGDVVIDLAYSTYFNARLESVKIETADSVSHIDTEYSLPDIVISPRDPVSTERITKVPATASDPCVSPSTNETNLEASST